MSEETMRIDAPPETKVSLAFPGNGYPGDQLLARLHLDVGEIYTVEKTEVHTWRTEVFLEGITDIGFNSVMFKEV